MSSHLAIAAVTRSIQSLLIREGLDARTMTPDQAASETGIVNLFLYHTMHNASWRNLDIPTQVRKGQRGNPPLALNLYYMLTAYGEKENLRNQELLASAMRVLHDHPILKPGYIRTILEQDTRLSTSDLADQFENVRIVPEFLDIENMSRLWTTFQTQYRVSAAYQASVVLIDSKRPSPSPMPVLSRGKNDQGVSSELGATSVINSIEYRSSDEEPSLPAAAIGSTITILGENLPPDAQVKIRDLRDDRSNQRIVAVLPSAQGSNSRLIRLHLDEGSGDWRTGVCSLSVEAKALNGRLRVSNSLPIALAPEILTSGGPASAVSTIINQNDRRILTLSLRYPIAAKREVTFTLNPVASDDDEKAHFQLPMIQDQFDPLNPTCDVTSIPRGVYWIRVSVDGIDSLLMRRQLDETTKRFKVVFDSQQQVRL